MTSRHRIPRLALGLTFVGSLAVTAFWCAQPCSESLIEEVYVLDSEETTCLSCPTGEIPGPVHAVLDRVTPELVGRWIQENFSTGKPGLDFFKKGDPVGEGLRFRINQSGGAFFQFERSRIYYESIPCWFWDCYKPRMWRVDVSGRRIWTAKVPFAQAPVYPFVVGDYVLFVGSSTGVDELVIVDLATGTVVERFAPEGERYGFQQSALLLDPAWYSNGYIRLRATETARIDIPAKRVIVEEPAKTYVLKVRF